MLNIRKPGLMMILHKIKKMLVSACNNVCILSPRARYTLEGGGYEALILGVYPPFHKQHGKIYLSMRSHHGKWRPSNNNNDKCQLSCK